jgi:enterochelin esterase-like enzyme
VSLGDVSSRFVEPRRVDVWLPPGYDAARQAPYPVLYMHDGQNLFSPGSAFGGAEWHVDEVLGQLISAGSIPSVIVVAVWNTARRREEYMPQEPVRVALGDTAHHAVVRFNVGDAIAAPDALRSDRYLRFLVDELKPRIDRTFSTRRDPAGTTIMGSSMGGLISCYAWARYPNVFGAAGCLSTHWPAGDGVVVSWLGAHLPARGTHRIWFDHGTATLDSLYAPFQRRMDTLMASAKWQRGVDWESRVYPGAEHSERAWAARLADPLRFLLRDR